MISASGNFKSPHVILPRKRSKDIYLKNAYPGTTASFNGTGWSNDEVFTEYFNLLINRLKPSKEDPILLIYNNHESHLNPTVIEMAKMEGKFAFPFGRVIMAYLKDIQLITIFFRNVYFNYSTTHFE